MAALIRLDVPPLPGGELDIDTPFSISIPGAADPLDLDAGTGQALLLKLGFVDLDLNTRLSGPELPGGELDIEHPLAVSWPGAPVTVYPAATIGRSTAPDDVPAGVYVPGKLSALVNYGISIFDGVDPTSGSSSNIGVITLTDPDGEFDALVKPAISWDGATLTYLRGDPQAPFKTYGQAARMAAAGVKYDARQKQLQLRSMSFVLENAELHGLRYDGTGGYNGTVDIAGNVRPITFGQVFNIAPVQINPALLIYEVSCTAIQALLGVRDGGHRLDAGTDYPSYDALAAATVPGGVFATCLTLGLFRLGGQPAKQVTADVQGDAVVLNGTGYPFTRGQIARRIATGRGAVRLDDATQIDFRALADLEASQPAVCGWYFNEAISKADALTRVMAGCLGWWAVRLNGLLAFGQVDNFTGTAAAVINIPNEVLKEPTMQAYGPPRQATYVGWSKNYTPQKQGDLNGDVDPVDAASYLAVSRYARELALWLARAWPTAPVVTIDGGYAFEVDAQLEATRQQRVLGVRRERWSIQVKMDPFADLLGRMVKITGWNRYTFGAAKTMLCAGISVAGQNIVTLDLYG